MAKKEKNNVVKKNIDKIGGLISKEIQKASEQLQDIVGDFSRQAEDLQKQVREPLKKFLTDMEGFRDRELKKIQEEYQRVIGELTTLQEVVSDKLGVNLPPLKKSATEANASKPTKAAAKPAKSAAKPASVAAKAKPARSKPASTAKPAAKTPAAAKAPAAAKPTATKPTTAKKPAAKSASKATTKAVSTKAVSTKAATGKGDDLTKLTGVGPALAKKLHSAGITSYGQIANPSESDQKALAQIGRVKNSDKWAAEAKALLG